MGSRIKLRYTRAIINAIHSGELTSAQTTSTPIFSLHVRPLPNPEALIEHWKLPLLGTVQSLSVCSHWTLLPEDGLTVTGLPPTTLL